MIPSLTPVLFRWSEYFPWIEEGTVGPGKTLQEIPFKLYSCSVQYVNLQTCKQTSWPPNLQLEIFFQYWNTRRKWGALLQQIWPARLSSSVSRVLKTTLEGPEHVFCSSDNVVNLPEVAGLQYRQVPPSRHPLCPQEHAEQRWAASFMIISKPTAVLFQAEQ